MNPSDRLLDLIQQLYAAPGTTEGWHVFLKSLRVAVNGSACSLLTQDLRSEGCSFQLGNNVDPEAMWAYDAHWGTVDPWAHSPNRGQLSRQSVIVGDELITHQQMRRTAYYQDFGRRYDMVRALIGVLETSAEALSVISVSGDERRGPFGEQDVSVLEPLVPHVRRALQLHRRLVAANRTSEELSGALDRFSRAVLLLDAAGHVTFMNRAAGRLTAKADTLRLDHGELRASRGSDTARLRSIVAEAVKTSSGSGFGDGGTVILGRPSGRRPLLVHIYPAPQRRAAFPGIETCAAIVFVTDPEQSAAPDEAVLRTLFSLTDAEARLTRLLAEGRSLSEAGMVLGVSRETVRSRLKTIFGKTNTHRQAELVRLVLNSVPQI